MFLPTKKEDLKKSFFSPRVGMGPSQSRFGYGEGSMFCVCFAYKFASCFFLGVKTTSSWFSLQHKKHLNKDNGTHMCLDFICTAGCFILTLQKTWICFR